MTELASEARARRLAWLVLGLVFCALTLISWNTPGEYYDTYETLIEGRRLVLGERPPRAPVRMPVFIGVAALGELCGHEGGFVALRLLSLLGWLGLVAGTFLLTRACGVRPWVAAGAALLVGTHHVALHYTLSGLGNVPSAAVAALTLACALRTETWRGALLSGILLGLCAACVPVLGVLGVTFLAGLRRGWNWPRLVLAGGASLAVYGGLAALVYGLEFGGLSEAWRIQREVLSNASVQGRQNLVVYGVHQPPFAYLWGLLVAHPLLSGLALVGAPLSLRQRRDPRLRIPLAWACLLLWLLSAWTHFEVRYVLPALPALAALAALALERLARRPRVALRAPWIALGLAAWLAWSLPFEVARLQDPVLRTSFPARVAAAVPPGGKVVWTTSHPFPVTPRRVLAEETYAGDPWFGILHQGPVSVGYHLGRPVRPVVLPPEARAGLVRRAGLLELVRRGRHADGNPFRPGDVLLVGVPVRSPTWAVRAAPQPPLGFARVVRKQALTLAWTRIDPHEFCAAAARKD